MKVERGEASIKALGDAFRRATRPLFRNLLRLSLPKLEGVVELPGLTGSVEVLRDRFGVPQVFSENEQDLFFAQGYVHAQDRFFQMELGRRAGHGRLSELLGESALELDRLSRAVGFGKIAAASEKNGPPETLQLLESYSAGVNARLASEPRPPELLLLRHHPEPWTPVDSAAWAVTVAWSLSASWESKLLHGYVEEENGSAGSNAWAVAPGRSATGSALLAGDPHLTLGIPGPWYEVGLYGGPYQVVGASLPGMPGAVIGHNQSIAWSVTAAMTDVQDLYVERFSKEDTSLYEHAGGWREAEMREEKIFVSGRREPVTQRVRTTLHGPVVSDVFGGEEDLALCWAAPEPLDLVGAGLAINQARNKEEFLDALQGWTAPNQNFVYADRTGVIGRALAGPVPVRKNHRGERPVPGWTGEYEWEGFMPFEEMPKSFEPEEGYIASANEAPATDAIPGDYLAGYRKDRIESLLQATGKHTLNTFRDIQGDLYCAPAHTLAGELAKLDPPSEAPEGLIPNPGKGFHRSWVRESGVGRRFASLASGVGKTLRPNEKQSTGFRMIEELAAWDGYLVAESRPGAVARVALEFLLRSTARISPRLDSPLPTGAESFYERLVPELVEKLGDLPEEALQLALREAVETLAVSRGLDPAGWSWGSLHPAELRHPLGVIGALRDLLNRGPYPTGGDANTVRMAAFNSGSSGSPSFGPVTTGPNYRFIVDTGNWDRAWSMVAPGQSGHPASGNYDDQVPLWQNVRYRPMVFGRKTAELAAKHRLVLRPEEG